MNSQHLSNEALAAFADGVLCGHARDRAARHAAGCLECANAVAVQREAVSALRTAPAPAVPSGLLDRLRSVPATTPINVVPATIGPDGSAMFAAFGTMASAALVAPARGSSRQHRIPPVVLTVAAVAAAGLVAFSSTGQDAAQMWKPIRSGPGSVVPAGFVHQDGSAPAGHSAH